MNEKIKKCLYLRQIIGRENADDLVNSYRALTKDDRHNIMDLIECGLDDVIEKETIPIDGVINLCGNQSKMQMKQVHDLLDECFSIISGISQPCHCSWFCECETEKKQGEIDVENKFKIIATALGCDRLLKQ